jgi:ribosomal protein L12E/L44/L45/RPP1/RPP2
MAVKGIRSQARNTLGVRVIRLDEGDEVRDAVVLPVADETAVPDAPADPSEGSPADPEPEAPEGDEETSDEESTDTEEDDDAPPTPR